MDMASDQKNAIALLGLTAAGFLLLVALTTSNDYGFILAKDQRFIWTVTRVYPALGWLSLAGVLILARSPLNWTSAATAFMITLIAGSTVAVIGAPVGIDSVSLMTSVCYYAIISAFLCLTTRRPVVAGLIAPAILLLQVGTDVAAHVATGVLQIGW
jgi:hypothetical protein